MKENKQYIAAVKLSVQVWIWRFHNPGKDIQESPYWDKIKNMICNCALCEYFRRDQTNAIGLNYDCKDCVLKNKQTPNPKGKLCIDAFYRYREDNKKAHIAFIASILRKHYERVTGDMQFREARG